MVPAGPPMASKSPFPPNCPKRNGTLTWLLPRAVSRREHSRQRKGRSTLLGHRMETLSCSSVLLIKGRLVFRSWICKHTASPVCPGRRVCLLLAGRPTDDTLRPYYPPTS